MKIEVKIERETGAAIIKTGGWHDRQETLPEAYVKQGQHVGMDMSYWRYKCKKPTTPDEHLLAAELLVEYAQLSHYELKMQHAEY